MQPWRINLLQLKFKKRKKAHCIHQQVIMVKNGNLFNLKLCLILNGRGPEKKETKPTQRVIIVVLMMTRKQKKMMVAVMMMLMMLMNP